MKYLLLLGDGMADLPVEALVGRTPLEAANKPHMDFLARAGETGMVKTIPEGMPTGSDTANMSCMGFDPRHYYSGRSPLEAVSMGVALAADDLALRCNLVTLSDGDDLAQCRMLDYSSDEISTPEARELVEALAGAFAVHGVRLHPGISYRHCLVIPHTATGNTLTPPHDILTRQVGDYMPRGRHEELLTALIVESRAILQDHPVNLARIARGLRPANCCWFWGEGTRPRLADFKERYGVTGGVVCAVDLIRGLGLCAGLRTIDVPGANGTLDTDYAGKAAAALRLFDEGCDFVYLHVEAPDECGHRQEVENKVKAIEWIDALVLGPILEALKSRGEDFAVLLMPDHPTPLALRTHTGDPVPYALYRSGGTSPHGAPRYTEQDAASTGVYVPFGFQMMDKLILGK